MQNADDAMFLEANFLITPTERKVIAIAYISSDDLAWAIGDDDTWIAPLSTSVDVDDQGNVITTGRVPTP